ncbi:hypothetical protein C8R43DRAFT_1136971 [Mycena crocata]|nr:hypothetical protein C8R43DRAFT_1136971 [Mycena crocata]
MFEGARWDPTYGSIIRVTGSEDVLGLALGRVAGADYTTGFALGRVVVLDMVAVPAQKVARLASVDVIVIQVLTYIPYGFGPSVRTALSCEMMLANRNHALFVQKDMLRASIPLPRPRAQEILSTLNTRQDEDYVWWGRRGPELSSYDVHGYPAAFMFGQVVGEILGDTTREIELAKPSFLGQLRLSDLVGNFFDAQCRHLEQFRHDSDEPVFRPTAVRQHALHGKVFRVALVRAGISSWLGEVILIRLARKAKATGGTELAVSLIEGV